MEKMSCAEYKPGRRFMGKLPHGEDFIGSIEEFCAENSIKAASFSAIGAVSSVTYGAYDQTQQVYISFQKHGPFEIVSCSGNVSLKDGKPFVHAHVVLGDEQGNTFGGHLFSETVVYAGEIVIRELEGKPLERAYDETTGLMFWK